MANSSQTILITGATGSNGIEILKLLAAQNICVRAMVRDIRKAHSLFQAQGYAVEPSKIELVEGDLDVPETLLTPLGGVNRAFLLTNSTDRAEAQQIAFVEVARYSRVEHIVKLSQLHANQNSPVRYLRYHAAVESAIQASGMTYTFLRPNLYMQGLLGFRSTIKDKNAFYAAAGEAKVSIVDVRDIAAVAVAALTESGHEGKTYDLTGPQALTHAQIAAHLSIALGHPIAFVDVPLEVMREAMTGMGMPIWQADGLIEDYAHYKRGEAAAVTNDIEEATGTAPRSFNTFAHDYAAMFG
jgi:uncharacterized protein YbjT (DUF2867 family)